MSTHFLRIVHFSLVGLLGLLAGFVQGQTFPEKPISIVIPFATGGINDTVTRPLAASMSKYLGQSVIVENRVGAGGAIGMAYVAHAKPDGYTILLATPNVTVLPDTEILEGKKPSYLLKELTPLAMLFADPLVLAANVKSKVQSIDDLIRLSKESPGSITYSASGQYGNSQIAMAMVEQAANIKVLQIPYKGGGPAMIALMSGEVDLSGQASGTVRNQMSSGKIKAIASFGREKLASDPPVPSFMEQGIPIEFYIWNILFLPAGTPEVIQEKLREAIRFAMKDPPFVQVMNNLGIPTQYLEGKALSQYVESEAKTLKAIVQKLGKQ